jgi:hypothetical protein
MTVLLGSTPSDNATRRPSQAFWEPPSDPAVQAELALNQWGAGES